MKYRTDIDGLRAVAVLPVILFHTGFAWLPGGFVGVDVFFVISGYLISALILREMEAQNFSFLRFYGRRARRILPALLVVIFFTLLGGYFFLLPDEYSTLSDAALTALTGTSNIYFWDSASTYFGLDIATQPLLHTWSLGIEEQFYLLFPALLFFLYRRFSRKVMSLILITLLVVSLTANVLLAPDFVQFTFYMLPPRAWELLAGVLLGIGIVPAIRNPVVANIAAMTGLTLIIGAMLLLDKHSVFPGINAVYPVLGTTLIIHSNTHVSTAVARLLSMRPLVLIGLISYSLYLWHWPLTVYTQMVFTPDDSRLFIVALSIVLAAISYRFVETRYRKPSVNFGVRRITRELGIIATLATAGAVFIISEQGFASRIPESALQAVRTENSVSEPAQCRTFTENLRGKPGEKGNLCRIGKKDGKPQFIVWGDSHAGAISQAFHLAALTTGVSGYSLSNGGCRPLAGIYRKHKHKCLNFNNAALQLIENTPSIQQVFLAGYWRIPLTSHGYDNSNFLIMDDKTQTRSPTENRKVFRRGLVRTIDKLKDRKVTIIEDVPEIGSQFGKSVANHFIRQAWLRTNKTKKFEFQRVSDRYEQEFSTAISHLPTNGGLLEITPWLCNASTCPLLIDGILAYADGDHLSAHGASVLVPALLPYMASYGAAASSYAKFSNYTLDPRNNE